MVSLLFPRRVSFYFAPFFFFFFNDTATTEIYTLSLHDALPICHKKTPGRCLGPGEFRPPPAWEGSRTRSEEHTSELQSRQYLVCRLLLEKKIEYFWTALTDGISLPHNDDGSTRRVIYQARETLH